MIGVVIVAHGELAGALLDTAQMICGEQDRVEPISLAPDESPESLYGKVGATLGRLGDDSLLVCDIPGGTPANVCARYAIERGCRVVCGANVPMLMEVMLGRDDGTNADALAKLALESGREGIIDLNELLANQGG